MTKLEKLILNFGFLNLMYLADLSDKYFFAAIFAILGIIFGLGYLFHKD